MRTTPITMPAFVPLDNPLEDDVLERFVAVDEEPMLVFGAGVFVFEFRGEVEVIFTGMTIRSAKSR
jgi:hypothetical protein